MSARGPHARRPDIIRAEDECGQKVVTMRCWWRRPLLFEDCGFMMICCADKKKFDMPHPARLPERSAA